MTAEKWAEFADTVLASSALTTRFATGHKVCSTTPVLRRAADFAAWKHDGQMRKGEGQTPYIHHPIEVCAMLAEVGGVTNLDILQAALLHDTIEDTETTAEELESHFDSKVCSIVLEVTDDTSLAQHARKAMQVEHAPHLSKDAQILKLADKISNIFDVAFSTPVDWAPERQFEYFAWASRVVAGLRGCNSALEALFDKQLAASRSAVIGSTAH